MLELQRNPKAKPISYWKNTSDNAIIRSFIDYAGSTITNKLETLMAGGCIVQRVDENLTYDYLHSSEDNLWSTLYLTGYLTKAREEDYKGELPDGMVALMIPNAEIKEIFETTVIKWFDDSTKKWNRNALFDAVWNGDSDGITKEMNVLLRRTISYHDYLEDFYPTRSMEKAEAMWLFTIPSMLALQSLKQSTRRYWKIWRVSAIRLCSKLMIGCTQRSMRTTMIRFFAMAFRSLRNAAW